MRIKPPITELCTAPQGSVQWLNDRAGVITGSMFHVVMDKLKNGGGYKASAIKYARQLALERIIGGLLDDTEYKTAHAGRGNDLENDARTAHEDLAGCIVFEAGFIRTLDRKFGISADGLIGADGGSEYKCFTDADKVIEVIVNGLSDVVTAQVQGAMWLTGRSWWHFGLYHPGLKKIGRDLSVIEIERDEAYIDELRTELAIFDNYVESIKQDILNSHQAPLKYPMHEEPAQQPLIEEEIVF
tara:strand:+ start:1403 stop:2131 length:729 start_codon:yes stop_codon:yes gene_type:complete